MLSILEDVDEANSSLLDNTKVLYGYHTGDPNIHNIFNLPIIFSCGGFRRSQHLAFNKQNNRPLAYPYLSMLHNMGLEADCFGSGTGTLTGVV